MYVSGVNVVVAIHRMRTQGWIDIATGSPALGEIFLYLTILLVYTPSSMPVSKGDLCYNLYM